MDNYVVIVVADDEKALEALHALWKLDYGGDVTVNSAEVIRRNARGQYEIATKRIDEGARTVGGAALGALIGAIAGPGGAAAGGVAGAVTGLTADALKFGEREEAAYEAGKFMSPGQSAVLAELSESSTAYVDALAQRVGGTVHRRPVSEVRNASMLGAPD